MQTKTTGILLSRASSWTLYLGWCSATKVEPTPLSEDRVSEYLRYAASVAPTRGAKFLESVGFAGHHLSMDVDGAFSARTRGIAHGGLKRKRDTKKMNPFSAKQVSE